jgi:hypothetical protein
LFRGLVILTFITIVCVIAYFLLSAMKKLYIDSWFFLDRSVVIGFLSGLLLTIVISFVNFHHAMCEHARERSAQIEAFLAETDSFRRMMEPMQTESGAVAVPEQLQPELERALARLDDCSGKLARSERISPLKSTTIEKRGKLASKIARAELAFDRAFAPFAEACSTAFHAHSILPYLKDETERQAAQEDFMLNLSRVSDALQEQSSLMLALRAYQDRIDRFLGLRHEKK